MDNIESWRVFLPYYAHRLEDNTYIIIGRDHKPLGCLENSWSWSKWEDHPIVYIIEGLTPQLAAQMSCRRDPNIERIYFYNGNRPPWRGKKYFDAHDKRVTKFLALARSVVRPERGAKGSVDCCVHG
jgi:hypothetical protein